MKVLVQRVSRAEVRVAGAPIARIGRGALVFLGVERGDAPSAAVWFAKRLANLRLFPDDQGTLWVQTLSEVGGAALVVSQFTLAARTRKGRRPSFDPAAPPAEASRLYRLFVDALAREGVPIAEGRFGALMDVELVNDGPVTFLLDGPEAPRS